MNDELLSVVDENDQVSGICTRSEIHGSYLRHRAVHILVFNSQKQLFLQKRSQNKDENPGLWDTSAAGHVDAGESYDLCAAREIEEELGVKLSTPLELLFKLPATIHTGMEFIQVYRCVHNGPFILQAEEITDGKWICKSEITTRVAGNDQLLTDSFKIIWRHYEVNCKQT